MKYLFFGKFCKYWRQIWGGLYTQVRFACGKDESHGVT